MAQPQLKILVTGGAGYIGSHTCYKLLEQGYHPLVLDNLSSGWRWAVPKEATFIEGDAGDVAVLQKLFSDYEIRSVLHLAGSSVVEESVLNPLKYYRNNFAATLSLLSICKTAGVRHFIFSSSAAVYGEPKKLPLSEDSALDPVSPYGTSKLMVEKLLNDFSVSAKADFSYVALRYFNVAGARSDLKTGQATPGATHLIKVACEVATGKRPALTVYGNNYPTPDGTCIRDYIHVDDIAMAHVQALRYLEKGGTSTVLNVGYGKGFSVREIVTAIEKLTGRPLPTIQGPARTGDPVASFAESSKIRKLLNWEPQHADLEFICRTAHAWEQQLKDRF